MNDAKFESLAFVGIWVLLALLVIDLTVCIFASILICIK